jgi:TrmH family RNA methyltransferase
MPNNSFKRYKSEFEYSYTLGIYPTIELLNTMPKIIEKVILDPKLNMSEGYDKILFLCKQNHIEIITDDFPFKILATKDNVYVIGIFRKYESEIDENENTVVLNNPENAGNVGTIIRTMVGFGVQNLAVIEPSVDLFSPEVVRASMGEIFKIHFEYFGSLEEYRKKNSNSLYYLSSGGNDLSSAVIKKPFSLIFGSEGAGLKKEDISNGEVLSIPMSKEIDSYNLAVSVGIALFHSGKVSI